MFFTDLATILSSRDAAGYKCRLLSLCLHGIAEIQAMVTSFTTIIIICSHQIEVKVTFFSTAMASTTMRFKYVIGEPRFIHNLRFQCFMVIARAHGG